MAKQGTSPDTNGPYHVERVETPDGPCWRLSGPGLGQGKGYPWEEAKEKLGEMAKLMNFAWQQATTQRHGRDQQA
jgi:hypothetical protein